MCGPSTAALEISAHVKPSSATAFAFDKECLAAPAQTRLMITFNNEDNVSHNFDILDHAGGTSFFNGKIILGPKTFTYKVKPLHPGSYLFQCDIHPLRMSGSFLVGG
jgi:plastocyanin